VRAIHHGYRCPFAWDIMDFVHPIPPYYLFITNPVKKKNMFVRRINGAMLEHNYTDDPHRGWGGVHRQRKVDRKQTFLIVETLEILHMSCFDSKGWASIASVLLSIASPLKFDNSSFHGEDVSQSNALRNKTLVSITNKTSPGIWDW